MTVKTRKTMRSAGAGRNTILSKLVLPVMAVMLLQAFLYIAILWQGGVVPHAEKNAYDILDERVLNRRQYIENEMIHKWSNVHEAEARVLSGIGDALAQEGRDVADIRADSALNERIVAGLVPDLIYLLRRNMVTGAFVVLDGPGLSGDSAEDSYAGFYLRDLDPSSYSDNNTDLMVERGMPDISKKMGLTFDSYWTPAFRFPSGGEAENERFFFQPLNAARQSDNQESANFGYWSGGFKLDDLDVRVITYSIPLIWKDGSVIGVLGVDITEQYLYSLLNYDEIAADKAGAYFLGITRDGGKTYERVSSNGPRYKYLFDDAALLTAGAQIASEVRAFDAPGRKAGDVLGSVQNFKLYNVNTPFDNERWALIGIVERDVLLQFSDQITSMSYLATAISLVLGILGVYLSSRMVTRPITALVTNLQKSDPNKPVALKKLNIKEIDELTDSIESLSHSVAESSSKISKILSLTKASIGVFEYGEGDDYVFCSSNLFAVLGWDDLSAGENLYLPRETFAARLRDMSGSLMGEAESTYRLSDGRGGVRYVQLTWMSENNKTLGAASDVTSDMLAKQKMEYERDYDILTNLYNRRAFHQKLSALFAAEDKLGHCALVMWDLDNLKYINDTYGHDYGDRYIVSLSECLQFFAARGGVVARRSGDEFYTFLYGYQDKDSARRVISEGWEQIQQKSFLLPNGIDYRIRVSGGIAWYPEDAGTWEELVHCADYAMYNVKHTIKGNLNEFDKASYLNDASVLFGQEALNKLIDNEMVSFAFQPIVDVETGAAYGYELLMRPPLAELKSPLEVLRIAQAQAKLYHIERLTWFKGMEAFAERAERGDIAPQAHAFLNSIGSQILSSEDLRKFEGRFAPYLDRVVLELMESEPGAQVYHEKKIALAASWHAQIAIDDYGAGYNSEASLIFLSPDLVKLDMSLVRDIDKDENRQNLLTSLISYVKTRGIKTLAEGVETEAEMRLLVLFGVNYLQGYYLARPAFEIPPINPDALRALREARGLHHG